MYILKSNTSNTDAYHIEFSRYLINQENREKKDYLINQENREKKKKWCEPSLLIERFVPRESVDHGQRSLGLVQRHHVAGIMYAQERQSPLGARFACFGPRHLPHVVAGLAEVVPSRPLCKG